VDPSIRYTSEDDLIRDVEIDDKIQWGALFSKPNLRDEVVIVKIEVTLTGDVHRGVSPGLQCEESRPIPNAGKR